MICPHCHREIDERDFATQAAKRAQAGRKYTRKLRPCPKCKQMFGARDLRKHLPQCRPTNQPKETPQ